MLLINNPTDAWSEQTITLGGLTYVLEYKFNSRDDRWRVDIYFDNELLIGGLKIMENQSLLKNYQLDNFNHGDIYCLRFDKDDKPVGFDNLGGDRPYKLVYFTNDEIDLLAQELG